MKFTSILVGALALAGGALAQKSNAGITVANSVSTGTMETGDIVGAKTLRSGTNNFDPDAFVAAPKWRKSMYVRKSTKGLGWKISGPLTDAEIDAVEDAEESAQAGRFATDMTGNMVNVEARSNKINK